jgi:hypothetical protein
VKRALPALALLAFAGCGGEERPAAPVTPASETTAPAPPPPSTPPPPPTPAAKKTAPLPGLPRWTAGYDSWRKLNRKPIPPRESDAHLSTKEVYASRSAAGGTFPSGTVIVKEGVRPDTDFIGLIAAMRKIEGANPDHNDWVFVEWVRDSPDAPFRKLAEGAVCEACHSGVAENDYVFTRG